MRGRHADLCLLGVHLLTLWSHVVRDTFMLDMPPGCIDLLKDLALSAAQSVCTVAL